MSHATASRKPPRYFRKRHHVFVLPSYPRNPLSRVTSITFAPIAHPLLFTKSFRFPRSPPPRVTAMRAIFARGPFIILSPTLERRGGFSQLTAATNNNVLILQHCGSAAAADISKEWRRISVSPLSISPSHVARKIERAIAKIVRREIFPFYKSHFVYFPPCSWIFFFFEKNEINKGKEQRARIAMRDKVRAPPPLPLSSPPRVHFSPTGTFSEHTRNYVHAGCKCRLLSSRVSQVPSSPRFLPPSLARVYTHVHVLLRHSWISRFLSCRGNKSDARG